MLQTYENQVHTPSQVPSLIEARGISKSFGSLKVLDELDLTLYKGETLSLVGNSGTGKSILVKMLVGLLQPDQGKIFLEGREVHDLDEREWIKLRRKISMLFQANALFDSLTVHENIAYPLREHFSFSEEEITAKVKEVLSWVLLPGIEQQYPSELSGGMRKRIGLARAIITEPDVLFYDEPTAGLDPVSTTVIDDMIKRFQRERGVTSIVITHDLKSAISVGDRIALLHDGKVLRVAPSEVILADQDPVVYNFFEGYRMTQRSLS